MSKSDRPLSPHLSIYRWPITMTLSILHRATGVAMSLGLIVLAYWLWAVSSGSAEYARFTTLTSTFVGQMLMIGCSFAFFYHFANGVRHLAWDTGRGFEKHQANASAWLVLLLSTGMTAVYWIWL
jgi:succinate dehydrogenase / fumarate reductase cytochrome b subunit